MKITIGILAYNESKTIGKSMDALGQQTLILNPGKGIHFIDVICVPNGCKDDTAKAAEEALEKLKAGARFEGLNVKVQELAQPGKANAWNRFVHEISDQDSDLLVFMDADVWIKSERALEELVKQLMADRDADIMAGFPMKDIAFKEKKSFFDRISLGITSINRTGRRAKLAGCLYCIRGSVARSIWLPTGLLAEDGMVGAMVSTDLFRKPPDIHKVRQAQEAEVVFESYKGIGAILKHEKRLVIGTAMNTFFFSLFTANAGEIGAGEYVRKRLDVDMDWGVKEYRKHIRQSGYWVLPTAILTRRFSSMKHNGFWKGLKKFPFVFIGFTFDLVVQIWANHTLKQEGEITW